MTSKAIPRHFLSRAFGWLLLEARVPHWVLLLFGLLLVADSVPQTRSLHWLMVVGLSLLFVAGLCDYVRRM